MMLSIRRKRLYSKQVPCHLLVNYITKEVYTVFLTVPDMEEDQAKKKSTENPLNPSLSWN